MARLFISPREIHMINDWTKEYMKDASGQKIYYYSVSTTKSHVHDVYDEAITKVFEIPVEIPAQVAQPQWETKMTNFGPEQTMTLEAFIHTRDLIYKGINISEGDYFTYGDTVFEIVKTLPMNNIFGQEEYGVSYNILGKLARPGEFDPKVFFPPHKDEKVPYEQSRVQKEFIQQRGLTENQQGETGDFRQVRDRLKEEMAPIALGEGPRVVDIKDATPEDEDRKKASSFNNESTPSPYDDE